MLRPLYELEEKGIITLTICAPYLEDIKCHIQKNTRMVYRDTQFKCDR